MNLPNAVVNAIKSVIGDRAVSLHEPKFNGNEWKYVKECIDSNFVSSVGKFVDQFEHDLALYTGAKHAIAVVNGTAALHISLLLSGVRSNDEVLVPSLTFVATGNAISYCGAFPHFVDCSEDSLGISPDALRDYLSRNTRMINGVSVNSKTGRAIRAIIPMHTFGHPVDLNGILEIASQFNLVVIEDAAESMGSRYRNRHTGTFGLFGVLSFNGNKTITTGGGGAILTNDPLLAKHAKHITTTAKLPHKWEYMHDEIGFNYRLPNINAALGCAQLERIDEMLESKRRLFLHYSSAFSGISGLKLMHEPMYAKSNYWLQAIILNEKDVTIRDKILDLTNSSGVGARPIWRLLHQLPMYANCPRADLSVSESLQQRVINIPSSSFLI